jgi:hypothetical protein
MPPAGFGAGLGAGLGAAFHIPSKVGDGGLRANQ